MPVVYNTGLHFNSIYVIESLPPGDLRSGLELYDSILLPAKHVNEGLNIEYHNVTNSTDLHQVLQLILQNCTSKGHGPILHFEAHGSGEGIALADGTHVPWKTLTPHLIAINRACGMNLLVLAMMCEGWDLTTALMPNDQAPVFMLIGPPSELSSQAVQEATKRFYSSLVICWNLNEALEAMNDNQPFEHWPIRPATAEILFCRVFRYYMQDLATGRTLQERENEIVAGIAKERNLTVLETAALRIDVHRDLTNYPSQYEKLRHPFLMLDLFPDNAKRFGLTYEKCVNNTTDGRE